MTNYGNKEVFADNLKYYMKNKGVDRNDICTDLGLKYFGTQKKAEGLIALRFLFYPLIAALVSLPTRPPTTSPCCDWYSLIAAIVTYKCLCRSSCQR